MAPVSRSSSTSATFESATTTSPVWPIWSTSPNSRRSASERPWRRCPARATRSLGWRSTGASAGELGIYAVAVNASEILLYLPEATAMALLPMVAQLDWERRVDRALQAFRSLAAITTGAILVAAVVGAPLLPIVFGSSFTASQGPFLWLLPGAIGYDALGGFS